MQTYPYFNIGFVKITCKLSNKGVFMQTVMNTVQVDEQVFNYANLSQLPIGYLSVPGHCFYPDEKAESIYEMMKLNPGITEFTVVEDNTAVGFLTRTALNEALGGKYGFTLHSGRPIREIMKTDFLKVEGDMPVDEVSRLAMQRPFERLYNPIVVEEGGKFSGIVTVKDLLDTSTKTALSERDEIVLMKDNLQIGIFFMDRDYTIQDHYSRFLEELLLKSNLCGKCFTDLLKGSVTAKELDAIRDYFDMVFERKLDHGMLDEINPLNELHYVSESGVRKVFKCEFSTIERERGEVFALAAIYDVTARIELQRQLAEEENKRQEEMKSVFELIQVEPGVFGDFLDDMEYEFKRCNKTLRNETMSAHEALVEVYQSIHAVKSNAVVLGLGVFGNKVHSLEAKIKELREQKEVSFVDMLNLTMDMEKLSREREGFKTTIGKINSYKTGGGASVRKHGHERYVLIKSLTRTVNMTSADMGKKARFVVDEVDDEAVENCPRRIIKETLMQLIRNSVVHGIESPGDRIAKGKKAAGIIRLSIKKTDLNIQIKLSDDGRGLDYGKIAKKALRSNLIKKEDAENKKELLKAIFSPGFSTAETESVHAGRGIGLNLVQDRVRDGKGSIQVKSESGKGTTFKIIFPVQ
jgi:two-component system chemotaxis sensor kinase CheA